MFSLYKLLFVYYKLKCKPQSFRRLTAHYHSVHKNFKIIHHRADRFVRLYAKLYLLLLWTDMQRCTGNSMVYQVMHISGNPHQFHRSIIITKLL